MAVAERIQTTSAGTAERWRDDIVAFAVECCHARRPDGTTGPIRLLPHQAQSLRDANQRDNHGNLVHDTVVRCWPKRDGKSFLGALTGVHRICMFPNTNSFVLANSERQGGAVIMADLGEIVQLSPTIQRELRPDIASTRDGSPMRIAIPHLGSSIEVLPCNWATVQGRAISPWGVLLSDEVHAAQDPNVFNYLAAQCEATNTQIVLSSQAGPPIEVNPIYNLYQVADADPGLLFDYQTEPRSPWAVERANKDRGRIPHALWMRMWGNAWGSTGEKLFDVEDVEAVFEDFPLCRDRQQLQELLRTRNLRPASMGAGLDRSMAYATTNTGDDSVWSGGLRTIDDHYYLTQQDIYAGSELQVMGSYQRYRDMGGHRGILEQYNAGDLAGKIPHFDLRAATGQIQVKLFHHLYELVATRRLHLPRECTQLREQMLAMQVDTTHALPRFEGKPHDDTVYSLIWMIEACGCGPIVLQRFQPKPRGM